jgi:sigma-B regulation protein RsbU (phosphoserine phosphatase)
MKRKVRIVSPSVDLVAEIGPLLPDCQCQSIPEAELATRCHEADILLLENNQATALSEKVGADRPTTVVLARDGEELPSAYVEGLADDLLVHPFRALELRRMLGTHSIFQSIRQFESDARAIPDLARKLQEDLHLAQKIQRRLIRDKFPAMGPLTVKSKYWCGLKAGGDYFDVFEFPGRGEIGIILADSSSYALSTSLIGSLMQFSSHSAQGAEADPARIVKNLFGKLRENLRERDRLSLFYGVLDKKTYELRYVQCGSVFALRRSPDGAIEWVAKGENPPLGSAGGSVPPTRSIQLDSGERILLASDGWAEALGSGMASVLETFATPERDSQELVNEMAFRLRKEVEKIHGVEDEPEEDFPMPPQDCSVMVLDIAKNLLRLATVRE